MPQLDFNIAFNVVLFFIIFFFFFYLFIYFFLLKSIYKTLLFKEFYVFNQKKAFIGQKPELNQQGIKFSVEISKFLTFSNNTSWKI